MEYILNLLAHGATVREIYKGLTPEDIQACLLFATKYLANKSFMPGVVEPAEGRFLLDECTDPAVALWLHEQKHEVVLVYGEARATNDDASIAKAFVRIGC